MSDVENIILLSDLLKGFKTDANIPEISVSNISNDSKKIAKGDVFVALIGAQRHGIDFAIYADRQGMSLLLYDVNDQYVQQRLTPLTMQLQASMLGVVGLNEHVDEIFKRFNGQKPPQVAEQNVAKADDAKTTEKTLAEKVLEQKAREQKIREQKALEEKALEEKALQERALEQKALEQKALEQKALEQKALEQKALEQKALEQKALEQKALEERALEQKKLEEKIQELKELERRALERKAQEDKALEEKAQELKALERKAQERKAQEALDKKAQEEKAQQQKALEQKALEKKALEERLASSVAQKKINTAKMVLIGVTGTDGKTSVTHLLVQALGRLELIAASIGTLGAGIDNMLTDTGYTTPTKEIIKQRLAEFEAKDCDVVVMEVSSHALAQKRVAACQFQIAVLTNFGSDHLDYHKTLSHYAAAKEKLFHWSTISKRVINDNDVLGQHLLKKFDDSSIISFSAKQQNVSAGVRLVSLRELRRGIELTIQFGEDSITIESQLIGDFNVENILAVVSVLVALNYSAMQIAEACHLLEPIPGRMQLIKNNQGKQIIIDFAHTEQALKASLSAAKQQTEGDLWCVFGCGGERDESKRARMGRVAEELADQVIITDDNPRHEDAGIIAKHILIGCKEPMMVRVIHNRKEAIEFAIAHSNKGDTVLIAGKGHERAQIIKDLRLPFNDVETAEACLRGGA